MPVSDTATRPQRRPGYREAGTTAVEFALLAAVFLLFLFAVLELMRLLFVYNTLQEVTRRSAAAAVNVYARDAAQLARIRQDAVLRTSAGALVLAPPITDANVRIDYLALVRDGSGALALQDIPESQLPNCVGQNLQICTANPNAPNCIRFVRARICDTAATGACNAVTSGVLFPMVNVNVRLDRATTIATAESLGYRPGTPPCAAPPPS